MNESNAPVKLSMKSLFPWNENSAVPEAVHNAYIERKDAVIKMDVAEDHLLVVAINKLAMLAGKSDINYFKVVDVTPKQALEWLQGDGLIQNIMVDASVDSRCIFQHGETASRIDSAMGEEPEEPSDA